MTDDKTHVEAGVPPVSARDAMRAKIFASKAVNRKEVEFFGATIELRQPTLGDIVNARADPDREAAVIDTLIKYSYIPKTDIRVFEEADADSFKTMPFGADFIRVSRALEELTEVNFLDGKLPSGETGSST